MAIPTQLAPRFEPPDPVSLELPKSKLLMMDFAQLACVIDITRGNEAAQLYGRGYYELGHSAPSYINLFVTETDLYLIASDQRHAPGEPRPLINAIKRCGAVPTDMFSRLLGNGTDDDDLEIELEFLAAMDDYFAIYRLADAETVINTILEYLSQPTTGETK